MPPRLLLFLCVISLASTARADDILVDIGATWTYLDDGTNPPADWRSEGFSETGWETGPAELGYGDNDEATVVDFGDPNNKYITTYFRIKFQADPTKYFGLLLQVLRDDGVVIYLNETEVWRDNMPLGPIDYLTLALDPVGGGEESNFFPWNADPSLLEDLGQDNVLAVEIHQERVDSSDISFDLRVTGQETPSATVVRGPYLQRGSTDSAVVRWGTDFETDSRVRYGLSPDELFFAADNPTLTMDHTVEIVGLPPATKIYYSIGSMLEVHGGGTGEHYLQTHPDTTAPTRVWAIGDSGTADIWAQVVRDAYLNTGVEHTDVWLMLGDNAYNQGTQLEYQLAVFDMYPMLLQNTFLWPTIGNHDSLSADSETESGVYYDVFDLPRAGESGGVASGTEAYYSFDHGDIHFICLNSEDINRQPASPMFTWLEADLGATDKLWIIAYWHHPPYTKGSHDSDEDRDSEGRMREMRERALPLLEDYGVDLVLCGHSHSFERSFLIDGHYGPSDTFSPNHLLDRGDGRTDGDGAYVKAAGASHHGAIFVVAGSSGLKSDGSFDHPAMFYGAKDYGSLILDIDGPRLDAKFLRETGAVDDWFTLRKDDLLPLDGFLFSTKGDHDFTPLGGPMIEDGDLVAYDIDDGSMNMIVDISDVIPEDVNVDAACRLANGDFLLSFATTETVSGLVGGPRGRTRAR